MSYLTVIYNKQSKPYTNYPKQLCSYLFEIFKMKKGMTFLEVGCGRGEFLYNFKELGLAVYGTDISSDAKNFQPDLDISLCNIDTDSTKYQDNFFDIIFSKSLVEHLRNPDNYFREMYRILKPDGLLIVLTPDWEVNYRTFFDDYTHRTPFTVMSLSDIMKINNFSNVNVCKFRQLPITWKLPYINYVCQLLSLFIPVRTNIKFLRWSRELMLCGSANK